MIKHVIWEDREGKGRLALKEERDIVIIKKLAGNNLPASHLFAVLDAAIPGWRKEAEALHLGRKHAWFTKTRQGRWGSLTFLLKVIRDVDMLDIPTTACLHVTCAGKLPAHVELWLGDLAPLAAALKKEIPQAVLPPEEDEESFFPFWCDAPDGSYLKLRVEEPVFIGLDQGVMLPGEPSGLIEPEQTELAQEQDNFQGGQLPEIEVI